LRHEGGMEAVAERWGCISDVAWSVLRGFIWCYLMLHEVIWDVFIQCYSMLHEVIWDVSLLFWWCCNILLLVFHLLL
jgi:hypothetical protein